MERVASLKEQALTHIEPSNVIYQYAPYSMHIDCETCHGDGKVDCRECRASGKVDCGWCLGSGDESYQTPVYDNQGQIRSYQTQYRSCSGCWGSGKKECGHCHGKGELTCRECSGHGVFTKKHKISAIAKRTYHTSTDNPWHAKQLDLLLNSKGLDFCAEKIDFYLDGAKPSSRDSYMFYYVGQSIAFYQPFSLKSKNYDCYAFASPPYVYVRPCVFDDLFSDEFAHLQQSFNPKGQIDAKQVFIALMMLFVVYRLQMAISGINYWGGNSDCRHTVLCGGGTCGGVYFGNNRKFYSY